MNELQAPVHDFNLFPIEGPPFLLLDLARTCPLDQAAFPHRHTFYEVISSNCRGRAACDGL